MRINLRHYPCTGSAVYRHGFFLPDTRPALPGSAFMRINTSSAWLQSHARSDLSFKQAASNTALP